MAQIKYRARLTSQGFPFNPLDFGQSVIVSGQDQNLADNYDQNNSVPQVYYMENVIPTEYGITAVNYTPITNLPYLTAGTTKSICFEYINSVNVTRVGQVVLAAVSNAVSVQLYIDAFNPNPTIISLSGVIGLQSAKLLRLGTRQFIHVFTGFTSYFYELIITIGVTPILTPITLTGLASPGSIIGFIESFGYLVAWDTSTIYWSSLLSPTDFTPSISGGAGYVSPNSLKGDITVCVPHVSGFIVFTAVNAVMALYQNLVLQPFYFREIINSSGIQNEDQIDTDPNSTNFYAITKAGIQLISPTTAQTVLPEVFDYLLQNKETILDNNRGTFTTYPINAPRTVSQLNIISDRYLCISYSSQNNGEDNATFSHVLIYDIILKRWGKLRIDHWQLFNLDAFIGYGFSTKFAIAGSINASNNIIALDLFSDVDSSSAQSVVSRILIGKFQFVRARLLQLDEVQLSSIAIDTSVLATVSIDGTNNPEQLVPMYRKTYEQSTNSARYLTRVIGKNVSLYIQGRFRLTSLELVFNVDSKR